jgi:hypothetical protein
VLNKKKSACVVVEQKGIKMEEGTEKERKFA